MINLKNYILASLVLGLSACATTENKELEQPTNSIYEDVEPIHDPFESVNRRVYKFNYYLDRYVILPITKRYESTAPSPAKKGVSNFLSNIGEINTFINSSLQLKPVVSAKTLSRFAINTTIGVLGIFDVATKMGINKHQEDFGQTLAYYGVGSGPYLILPLLGPSNLRDLGGIGAGAYAFNKIDPLNFDDNPERAIIFNGLRVVDTRAKVPVGYFGSGSPFEYELLRRYYTDSRKIAAGSFKDRFKDDKSDEEESSKKEK